MSTEVGLFIYGLLFAVGVLGAAYVTGLRIVEWCRNRTKRRIIAKMRETERKRARICHR